MVRVEQQRSPPSLTSTSISKHQRTSPPLNIFSAFSHTTLSTSLLFLRLHPLPKLRLHLPPLNRLRRTNTQPPKQKADPKSQTPPYRLSTSPYEHAKRPLQVLVVRVPQLPRAENDLHCAEDNAQQREHKEHGGEETLEVRPVPRLEAVEMPAAQM